MDLWAHFTLKAHRALTFPSMDAMDSPTVLDTLNVVLAYVTDIDVAF